MTLRFELPAAPSTNGLYATVTDQDGTPRRVLVARARDWKTDAVARVKVGLRLHYVHAAIPPMPPLMAVSVVLHWKPSGRKRDLDNQLKLLLDALALGLDVDDSRFRRLSVERVDTEPGEPEYVQVAVAPYTHHEKESA